MRRVMEEVLANDDQFFFLFLNLSDSPHEFNSWEIRLHLTF